MYKIINLCLGRTELPGRKIKRHLSLHDLLKNTLLCLPTATATTFRNTKQMRQDEAAWCPIWCPDQNHSSWGPGGIDWVGI